MSGPIVRQNSYQFPSVSFNLIPPLRDNEVRPNNPIGQQTNCQFSSVCLSLIPSIREFQKGPSDRIMGEGERLVRKAIGELCCSALIIVAVIEALVRGILGFNDLVNSFSKIFEATNPPVPIPPIPAPESSSVSDQANSSQATIEEA